MVIPEAVCPGLSTDPEAPGSADPLERAAQVLDGPGRPLDPACRSFFEWYFGRDFREVRIHDDAFADASSRAFEARAYASGDHIVFAAGEYRPSTADGLRLLAHELTHVCQQRDAGGRGRLRWDGVDPSSERVATWAAERALSGRPLPRGFPGTKAAAGSIQCHPGFRCPGPPEWWPIEDLSNPALWGPANTAIELAYLADPQNAGHAVLLGSQFNVGPGRDIQLPRGVPNRKLANQFLSKFRGISNQLAPDIMDFTDRTFYEIKTRSGVLDGIRQLQGYYSIIEAIRISLGAEGGPSWNQDLASWYPAHTLPFPGDPTKRVCTQLTEYGSPGRRGLIVYGVLQFLDEEKRKQRRAAAAANTTIGDLAPELEGIRAQIQDNIRKSLPAADPGQVFRIVASDDFYQAMIIEPNKARVERVLDLLRVKGFDLTNPVLQVRAVGWGLIGLALLTEVAAAVTLIGIFGAPLILGGAAAAAPPAAAAGGGAAAVDTAALLNILRTAKAANDVTKVAAAAGVIFVIGRVDTANAAQPKITRISTAQVIPVDQVDPPGDYASGRAVRFGGQSFREIGTATAGDGHL
jgi:hypothetical protein